MDNKNTIRSNDFGNVVCSSTNTKMLKLKEKFANDINII